MDGGFESGGTGWIATTSDTQLVIDEAGPRHSGARAARIEAATSGNIGINTQYWLVPTVAQVEHTLRVWVYDDAPTTSNVEVELAFITSDGLLRNRLIVPLSGDVAAYRLVTVVASGLEGTAYARVTVRAQASVAGAKLYVDDVSLDRAPLPPPTPTPSPTVAPTPSPTATPEATPTATPTSSPTATPTSTASPTPTAAPSPRLFDVLTNGGFEDGLYGWGDVGADVDVVGGLEGSSAARLSSHSTSTKYLYQTVRITPGAWYAGSARLRLGPGVDAAWMRIAWYASEDGSGSQLATGDSGVLSGGDGTAGDVAAGPLQAPAEAHTAQVRIMLRPLASDLAQLTVDAVRFAETSAPPPPAPTPTPAATAPPAGAAATAADDLATIAGHRRATFRWQPRAEARRRPPGRGPRGRRSALERRQRALGRRK